MNNSEILTVVKNVFTDEISALNTASNKINDEYIKAVELISNSNKVIISGVGKSGMIARKIAATLSSIGCSALFLHPVEALHGDIGMVQSNDVAILISKSGGTEEIVRLVPYLKMLDAKIIAITGNLDSFLSRKADITLDASVEREACPFNLAPTSSSTLQLVIGDALAIGVMKFKNVSSTDFARLHPLGQLGRNLTLKVKDTMHRDTALPIINKEASLKDAIIEISRKRLGCVCIVDENLNLEGIVTDGDIRRILQEYDDIRDLKVSELMTVSPTFIHQDAFLGEAVALMENRNSQISMLPVLESGKLIGIIRIHDIVQSGV